MSDSYVTMQYIFFTGSHKLSHTSVTSEILVTMFSKSDIFFLNGFHINNLDARRILKKIQRLGKIFENIWLATNYKCGTRSTDVLPDLQRHSLQADEMMFAIKSTPAYVTVAGVMLWGPSQPNFFAATCSLLPVSIPSMLATYLTTIRGKFSTSVLWEASRKLGFQTKIPVVYQPRPQEVVHGDFCGSDIWRYVQAIENDKAEVMTFLLGPNYNAYFNKYLIKTKRNGIWKSVFIFYN